MQRRICHFNGRVQGVGFRYTAHNLAIQYPVQGYVRNLPDGRVELVMEGPDSEMDELLKRLHERLGDHIRAEQVVEAPATGEFTRFEIRH